MTYDEFINAGLALCAARGIDLEDADGARISEVVILLAPDLDVDEHHEDEVGILRRALRHEGGARGWDRYPAFARRVLENRHDL